MVVFYGDWVCLMMLIMLMMFNLEFFLVIFEVVVVFIVQLVFIGCEDVVVFVIKNNKVVGSFGYFVFEDELERQYGLYYDCCYYF